MTLNIRALMGTAAVPSDPYFPYVAALLHGDGSNGAQNNTFVDSSSNNTPINRFGNVTQGSFSPYGDKWSNYFNGSSCLTFSSINLSGDFTIEGWVYFIGSNSPTVLGANPPNHQSLRRVGETGKHYFYREGVDITGTANVPLNQWVHLAATRSSGTVRIFTNGVLDGSRSIPGVFSLNCLGAVDTGTDLLTGYTSNIRVVDGTALYTATFTPPTTPLTAVSGTVLLTSQSNRFKDSSSNNVTLTRQGTTSVQKFSPFSSSEISYNQNDITNWSWYFDGDDYVTAPNNVAFGFGTGDYTVEFWMYLNTLPPSGKYTIVDFRTSSSGTPHTIYVDPSGYLGFFNGSADITSSSTPMTAQSWTHIAYSRASGTLRIYVNGVQAYSAAHTNNYDSSRQCRIGAAVGAIENITGYISNFRVVKGTAVYTSAFTPPTSRLTAISGTTFLTLQDPVLIDNSTNNFVITPSGNPTATGNSPLDPVGYWSNYFDGNGDYLSIPSNSALDFGTGDFTIECWTYRQSGATSDNFIISSISAGGLFFGNQAGGWGYGRNQVAWDYTSGVAPVVNTWQHVAITRSGTSIRMFVNGTQIGTTQTSSQSYSLATGGTSIGSQGASYYYNGHLSNLRVVKGTALYTSNFTVPTTPPTAVSGTSLLTCQNSRFVDNSTNAFTITRSGDVSVRSFDPFYSAAIASNGGSIYFDGSGDYLATAPTFNLPSSYDFTLEFWLYPLANFSSNRGLVACGGARFGLITEAGTLYFLSNSTEFDTNIAPIAGAWNHIALVRSNGTIRFFMNGIQYTNSTGNNDQFTSQTLRIGNNQSGEIIPACYMSDVRWSYVCHYTSDFTPPTAPLTPTTTTALLVNGMNANVVDASKINNFETVGNAIISTSVKKFGTGSLYFDGSGDYLTAPNSHVNNLGTGDFTIELWFKSSNGTMNTHACLVASYSSATQGAWAFKAQSGDTGYIEFASYGPSWNDWVTTTNIASDQQWHHCAVTRSGNTLRIFVDGTVRGTWDISGASSFTGGGHPLTVGFMAQDSTSYINGYIDDVRITKGVARYTTNFTVPSKAFPDK